MSDRHTPLSAYNSGGIHAIPYLYSGPVGVSDPAKEDAKPPEYRGVDFVVLTIGISFLFLVALSILLLTRL